MRRVIKVASSLSKSRTEDLLSSQQVFCTVFGHEHVATTEMSVVTTESSVVSTETYYRATDHRHVLQKNATILQNKTCRCDRMTDNFVLFSARCSRALWLGWMNLYMKHGQNWRVWGHLEFEHDRQKKDHFFTSELQFVFLASASSHSYKTNKNTQQFTIHEYPTHHNHF